MNSSATYRFFGIALIAFCFAFLTWKEALAQSVPQRFSYQAVIRDGANQLMNSQPVGIRLSILQGSESGTAAYVETHSASTNSNGLVSLQVGSGIVVSGALSQIDWASGPYFIKTETDPSGGSNYSITGTSQMLSVPYALFSANGTPGPQGPAGATGPQGPAGQTGATGATGPQGPIGLTGPAGAIGASGPQGPAGQTGATGPQGPIGLTGPTGAAGSAGSNGKNALIRTTPEAAGANCANGGIKIEAGLDADANGQLSDAEVNASQTKFLCNGATGATGATGAQGPTGPAGSGGFVHYVGEQFGGGVVFHVYKDGSGTERGFVVSLTNQSEGTAWSNITNSLAGASSSWDGIANSNAIVAQLGHTNSAAKLCLDYVEGGFSDWYLPSKHELNLLWFNLLLVNKSLVGISGATEILPANSLGYYWSSSEFGLYTASPLFSFSDNNSSFSSKDYNNKVRAIRAFSVPTNSGSVTDLDGNNYETVTIGSQVWMKENLKVSKYRNGDLIPTNISDINWLNATSGAFAIYANNPVNDSIYGKLYNWYAVADPRGLCPAGWHVPSDEDWKALETYLGISATELDLIGDRGFLQNVGGKLKAMSNLWQSPNSGVSNESGFTGIPGGLRNGSGTDFGYIGFYGVWWTSSEITSSESVYRLLPNFLAGSTRNINIKSGGFSVRCLKD